MFKFNPERRLASGLIDTRESFPAEIGVNTTSFPAEIIPESMKTKEFPKEIGISTFNFPKEI